MIDYLTDGDGNLDRSQLRRLLYRRYRAKRGYVRGGALKNITQDELNTIIDSHYNWISSKGTEGKRAHMWRYDLSGLNLAFRDLSGIDFFGSRLIGADLSVIRCVDTTYNSCDCTSVSFDWADLRGACFDNSNCTSASFDGADLDGASFDEANLECASFDEAALGDAYLGRAKNKDKAVGLKTIEQE